MDFTDLQNGIQNGRYTNHRVLPLRKYEHSKYSDYDHDTKLFMAEQERINSLFVMDCRRAFEGYLGRILSREQWSLAWNHVFTESQGSTMFGIISNLANLAPILDQFLMYHKTNRRPRRK